MKVCMVSGCEQDVDWTIECHKTGNKKYLCATHKTELFDCSLYGQAQLLRLDDGNVKEI
jgi:hypothetical protein